MPIINIRTNVQIKIENNVRTRFYFEKGTSIYGKVVNGTWSQMWQAREFVFRTILILSLLKFTEIYPNDSNK